MKARIFGLEIMRKCLRGLSTENQYTYIVPKISFFQALLGVASPFGTTKKSEIVQTSIKSIFTNSVQNQSKYL